LLPLAARIPHDPVAPLGEVLADDVVAATDELRSRIGHSRTTRLCSKKYLKVYRTLRLSGRDSRTLLDADEARQARRRAFLVLLKKVDRFDTKLAVGASEDVDPQTGEQPRARPAPAAVR